MAQTAMNIHNHTQYEKIDVALYPRTINLTRRAATTMHHIILVEGGEVRLKAINDDRPLTSPAVYILPAGLGSSLAVSAGAHGRIVSYSTEMLVDAIGDEAESYALRILMDNAVISDGADGAIIGEMLPLLNGLGRELTTGKESWMALSAYLRLLLIILSRAHGSSIDHHARGEAASVLQRYRKLVEGHFREQKPISFYARALGVTPDRLHAICTRELQRPPLVLLHQRVIHEAQLRLERSAGTIQQISAGLGFRDATYFSHFFKQKTGCSPAEYRRIARRADTPAHLQLSAGYSDWP